MEEFKRFDEILKPDGRQKFFVLWEKASEDQRLELKDLYEIAEKIRLHEGVPEVIRNHFTTAQNLLVYSWFFYPFNVTAEFLAFVTLEFALKERFALEKGSQKGRETMFKGLVKKAVDEGWVKDEGFSHIHNQSKLNSSSDYGIGISSQQVRSYTETLIESLPFIRNELAHGSSTLHPDGAFSVRLCAEFINQLFTEKST